MTSSRFGPFVLDRAGYRALRNDVPLDLTPKLLDLLIFLVDHAGSLVTKEQLLDALWPDANVTDNALAQAISELREALDDHADKPRYIKTVARRGYRFIAPVEAIDVGPAKAGPHDYSRAGLQISSYVGSGFSRTYNPVDGETDAIAVLDFVNVTGDAESAWLSAGIAETVTSDLRALGHFRVIDRWRVMEAARRTDGSLHGIADNLGARLAVVGSYQRNRSRVRITARVVDVVNGLALADAKVDGAIDAIFSLQDQVVAQFSSELGLAAGGTAVESARDTASLDAYRAFSEGWIRLESLDVREIPDAIAQFERAIAADPRYALAYTGLASAELAFYETTRSENEPAREVLRRAIDHARHGIQLNDALAEAHASLALVLVSAGETAEAAEAARRAVAIEPSNWRHLFRLGHASWGEERLRAAARTLALYPDFAFAHFQTAMVHVARGHVREAETVLRQGAAVQDRQIARGGRYPALGLHWLLGLVRLAQNDVEEAIVEFDREHRFAEPHRLYGREYATAALHARGAALLEAGRTTEAIDSFQRALALDPDNGIARLGWAIARGEPPTDGPLAVLDRARPAEGALVRAQILTARHDADGANAALEQMLDAAAPGFAGWTIPVEPFLKELHRSQGFAGILTRLAERAR